MGLLVDGIEAKSVVDPLFITFCLPLCRDSAIDCLTTRRGTRDLERVFVGSNTARSKRLPRACNSHESFIGPLTSLTVQ